MTDKDGVIATVGIDVTETVATAAAVHVPEPTRTEYVVVVVGDTVTVADAGGFVPLLAVHAKGPAPLEVKFIDCPAQIEDIEGVIATAAGELTFTVITEKLVQEPDVLVTVYVVVAEGVVTTTDPVEELRPVPGTQEYVPVPPLAVNVALCPTHKTPVGLCVTGNEGVVEKLIATV